MEDREIRERVARVNRALHDRGLVTQTWGNASEISDNRKFIYIKPSGVPFSEIDAGKIVKTNHVGISDEGYKPSVDIFTHTVIYGAFDNVGGVVHTHSSYATSFAQAREPIPCLGTTHADYFNGEIPLVDSITEERMKLGYEWEIGTNITHYFESNDIKPLEMPAALVPSHGPFVWGRTLEKALENALVLEEVAKLAYRTIILKRALGKEVHKIDDALLNIHFSRKHGPDSYYGQESGG